jgi:4-nitrophenyl phosphatase
MFDIRGHVKLFAFDLDGTLYVGERATEGAMDLIEHLRPRYRLAFFTNNSSKTQKEVFDKLNRLGLGCQLAEVYACASATATYLMESGMDNTYVVGSASLRSELEGRGVRVVSNDSAQNVVVGLDHDLTYTKIATALSILLKGGRFVACNEDARFPVAENRYMPGCGAMVGAIAGAIGRRPDFIVGKPNTYILSKIAEAYGVERDEIVVVGDSYESDIVMGLNYGAKGILVNSPDTRAHPDVLVLENLAAVLRHAKED